MGIITNTNHNGFRRFRRLKLSPVKVVVRRKRVITPEIQAWLDYINN